MTIHFLKLHSLFVQIDNKIIFNEGDMSYPKQLVVKTIVLHIKVTY